MEARLRRVRPPVAASLCAAHMSMSLCERREKQLDPGSELAAAVASVLGRFASTRYRKRPVGRSVLRAGVRLDPGSVCFDPLLPSGW